MVNPNGKFMTVWAFVLIFLMLYTASIMPYKLAFVDSEGIGFWFFFDLSVDGLFICDILINLQTPYLLSDGSYEKSRCKIFMKYLKTWLFIDIFASFPVNLIELGMGTLEYSSEPGDTVISNDLIRLARLPRMYKLLRMARLMKILKMFKNSASF